jgi:hypothetical protein
MLAQGCGYYVYGIVGGAAGASLEELPEEGVDPTYPVHALSYRAVQAIVSKVSLEEFGQEALETNLHNPDWLGAKVHAHENILETVLMHHTLIPMRFGTIFWTESRALEMLARYYDDLVDTLARLEGKKEWGVKVYADDAALAGRVTEFSDRARKLETEMAGKSGGAAYLWKKRLEEAIAAEIERVRDECTEQTHDRLSSHAEESAVNPLLGKEITGRTEEMILNGAYLVADERLEAFRAELSSLQGDYGALGLGFQTSGPWPAYNFVHGVRGER